MQMERYSAGTVQVLQLDQQQPGPLVPSLTARHRKYEMSRSFEQFAPAHACTGQWAVRGQEWLTVISIT